MIVFPVVSFQLVNFPGEDSRIKVENPISEYPDLVGFSVKTFLLKIYKIFRLPVTGIVQQCQIIPIQSQSGCLKQGF